MPDNHADHNQDSRPQQRMAPRSALIGAGIVLLLVGGCYALFQIVLGSPALRSRVGTTLSNALHLPVTVEKIALRGRTLKVEGLAVGNPGGFPAPHLVAARTIAITPVWTDLLGGTKTIRNIKIEGLSINLEKDRSGVWNFNTLVSALAGKKSDDEHADVRVRHLLVEGASVRVDGRLVEAVTLRAENLSSRGDAVSSVKMGGKALGGDIALQGRVRLGKQALVEVGLQATPLLSELVRSAPLLDLAGGRADLLLKARWSAGRLAFNGTVQGRGATVRLRQGGIPLEAVAHFAGSYDRAVDLMALDRLTLQVNRILNFEAQGKVVHLRGERAFNGVVKSSAFSLSDISAQLPVPLRRSFLPEGRFLPLHAVLSGDGIRGITAGEGRVSLRGGAAAVGGKTVVRGVDVDLTMKKAAQGWILQGKLLQGKGGENIPVQEIGAPFSASFSPRLRLVRFDAPLISARVLGSPATGRITVDSAASAPASVNFTFPELQLVQLNPLLEKRGAFSSGTLSASFQGEGRSVADMRGALRLSAVRVDGSSGVRRFVVGEASTEATVAGTPGGFALSGALAVRKGAVDSATGDISFAYRVDRERFVLERGMLRLPSAELDFTQIAGSTTPLSGPRDDREVPLRLQFSGIRCRVGTTETRDVSGTVTAVLHSAGTRRWLEGESQVSGMNVSVKGAEAGKLNGRFHFRREGAQADVEGLLFGGKLKGRVLFDPFDMRKGGSVSTTVSGLEVARLTTPAATPQAAMATAGTVDAAVDGAYQDNTGFVGSLSVNGRDIAFTGKGNKVLLSGVAFRGQGDVAGGKVTLRDAAASAGKEVGVSLRGTITDAFTPRRSGTITVALPPTRLEAVLDSFVNVVPRQMQEATVSGNVSADSVIGIKGEEIRVDGKAILVNAALDVPGQKLTVTDVRGVVPYSLAFPRPPALSLREKQHPSRETYPVFLEFLQFGPHRGSLLMIGRTTFGALELGETAIRAEAATGVVSINSVTSTLAGGLLVGRGYYAPGSAGYYGGDLLVHDLSLRKFCAEFPALKDYISGKLDGIFSLAGAGKDVAGNTGFVHLWTRSSSDEKMLVSKEFLQKIAGKQLRGIFFRNDRSYDRGEISAWLEKGYLTFEMLDISHTNLFGVRDLSVSVAPVQNSISLEHLLTAIREAATRGKAVRGDGAEAPVEGEFQWQE